jgi:hypothetical protein
LLFEVRETGLSGGGAGFGSGGTVGGGCGFELESRLDRARGVALGLRGLAWVWAKKRKGSTYVARVSE